MARVPLPGVPVQRTRNPAARSGIDLEALEATLAAKSVKLMVLTPDFQIRRAFHSLLRSGKYWKLPRASVAIVEDHIYARLYNGESAFPSQSILIAEHRHSHRQLRESGVPWIARWLDCCTPTAVERCVCEATTDLHTTNSPKRRSPNFIRRGMFAKHLSKMRKVTLRGLERDEALRKQHAGRHALTHARRRHVRMALTPAWL